MTPVPTQEQASPSPRKGRKPQKTPRRREKDKPVLNVIQTVDDFQQGVRDKAEMGRYQIVQRRKSDLQLLASQGAIRKVIVDPDNAESAAASSRAQQISALTLMIAQKVKSKLESKGFEAVLTRSDDQYVPAGKKLEIITGSNAQVLLSIRIGDTEFPDVSGYRILYVSDAVDYAAAKPGEREQNALFPLELSYLAFQEKNKVLSSAMLNAMKALTSENPVGVNPMPLYYAKRAPMASTLVEVGYISNGSDAKRLLDPGQQEQLAGALVGGLTEYAATLSASGPRETSNVSSAQ